MLRRIVNCDRNLRVVLSFTNALDFMNEHETIFLDNIKKTDLFNDPKNTLFELGAGFSHYLPYF